MNNETIISASTGCAAALALLLIIVGTSSVRLANNYNALRDEAIARGHATWIVDTNSINGNVPTAKFVWIEKK